MSCFKTLLVLFFFNSFFLLGTSSAAYYQVDSQVNSNSEYGVYLFKDYQYTIKSDFEKVYLINTNKSQVLLKQNDSMYPLSEVSLSKKGEEKILEVIIKMIKPNLKNDHGKYPIIYILFYLVLYFISICILFFIKKKLVVLGVSMMISTSIWFLPEFQNSYYIQIDDNFWELSYKKDFKNYIYKKKEKKLYFQKLDQMPIVKEIKPLEEDEFTLFSLNEENSFKEELLFQRRYYLSVKMD